MSTMKVGWFVFTEVHADDDSEEPAKFRHFRILREWQDTCGSLHLKFQMRGEFARPRPARGASTILREKYS